MLSLPVLMQTSLTGNGKTEFSVHRFSSSQQEQGNVIRNHHTLCSMTIFQDNKILGNQSSSISIRPDIISNIHTYEYGWAEIEKL